MLSTKFTFWVNLWLILINPFPHIDAFWRLCSRQLFENIVIGYPFNYRDFLFFDKIWSKSSAAELSYEGKGWNHFFFIYISISKINCFNLIKILKIKVILAAYFFWKHFGKRRNCLEKTLPIFRIVSVSHSDDSFEWLQCQMSLC